MPSEGMPMHICEVEVLARIADVFSGPASTRAHVDRKQKVTSSRTWVAEW
ncbi:hypothetical protein V1264_013463 [Littorina saxatilis]|uniref:Uncharacterized protein n=1 Tax=Littorina saxatilis TaxID=31220 RepID=A0AAN9BPL0_9CAEN